MMIDNLTYNISELLQNEQYIKYAQALQQCDDDRCIYKKEIPIKTDMSKFDKVFSVGKFPQFYIDVSRNPMNAKTLPLQSPPPIYFSDNSMGRKASKDLLADLPIIRGDEDVYLVGDKIMLGFVTQDDARYFYVTYDVYEAFKNVNSRAVVDRVNDTLKRQAEGEVIPDEYLDMPDIPAVEIWDEFPWHGCSVINDKIVEVFFIGRHDKLYESIIDKYDAVREDINKHRYLLSEIDAINQASEMNTDTNTTSSIADTIDISDLDSNVEESNAYVNDELYNMISASIKDKLDKDGADVINGIEKNNKEEEDMTLKEVEKMMKPTTCLPFTESGAAIMRKAASEGFGDFNNNNRVYDMSNPNDIIDYSKLNYLDKSTVNVINNGFNGNNNFNNNNFGGDDNMRRPRLGEMPKIQLGTGGFNQPNQQQFGPDMPARRTGAEKLRDLVEEVRQNGGFPGAVNTNPLANMNNNINNQMNGGNNMNNNNGLKTYMTVDEAKIDIVRINNELNYLVSCVMTETNYINMVSLAQQIERKSAELKQAVYAESSLLMKMQGNGNGMYQIPTPNPVGMDNPQALAAFNNNLNNNQMNGMTQINPFINNQTQFNNNQMSGFGQNQFNNGFNNQMNGINQTQFGNNMNNNRFNNNLNQFSQNQFNNSFSNQQQFGNGLNQFGANQNGFDNNQMNGFGQNQFRQQQNTGFGGFADNGMNRFGAAANNQFTNSQFGMQQQVSNGFNNQMNGFGQNQFNNGFNNQMNNNGFGFNNGNQTQFGNTQFNGNQMNGFNNRPVNQFGANQNGFNNNQMNGFGQNQFNNGFNNQMNGFNQNQFGNNNFNNMNQTNPNGGGLGFVNNVPQQQNNRGLASSSILESVEGCVEEYDDIEDSLEPIYETFRETERREVSQKYGIQSPIQYDFDGNVVNARLNEVIERVNREVQNRKTGSLSTKI